MIAKLIKQRYSYIEFWISELFSSFAGFLFKISHLREKIVWRQRKLFRFLLPYLEDHGLLRSENFATIATWRNFFLNGVIIVFINDVCMCARILQHEWCFRILWHCWCCVHEPGRTLYGNWCGVGPYWPICCYIRQLVGT